MEFTAICFVKVFEIPYSSPTSAFCKLFKSGGSTFTSTYNAVMGRNESKKLIAEIDLTTEDAKNIINTFPERLVRYLYKVLINNNCKTGNISDMVYEILKYSLTFSKDIQKKVYDMKGKDEFKKIIKSLQKMEPDQFGENDKTVDIHPISIEESYIVRHEEIRRAVGDVYIYGSTLRDALSTDAQNKNSIIEVLLYNRNISNINIFLLNYVYLDIKSVDGNEDGSAEIERSILNFIGSVKRYEGKLNKHINIILLSDFHMRFALLTSNVLISRSTLLFTKERNFKGQYMMFGNKTIEYTAVEKYLKFLVEHAYDVDLASKKESEFSVKKAFQDNKIRRLVSLKKVHPAQLYNLSRSTYSENIAHRRVEMDTWIKPDQNQSILLDYLKNTQNIFTEVIQQHDKNGYVEIIPSLDLGMPNNITRIAGGFLTGALYDWNCSVPIIPVDATVNTCTSSVFSLSNFDNDIGGTEFGEKIKILSDHANDNGYALNFLSGNHFLTVAKGDDEHWYLVLHSSAKECKESCFGLYPSERVWYSDYIKTYINTEQNRYLRYIRGDAAIKFVDYSQRFSEYNKEIHCFIAEEFARIFGVSLAKGTRLIRNHYGMPTPNSIMIGTFALDVNSSDRRVPIFSDYGKEFCIFDVSPTTEMTHRLIGTFTDVAIVPHGWGQVIDGLKSISLSNISNELDRELTISLDTKNNVNSVDASARLSMPEKHIRSYSNIKDFISRYDKLINGRIVRVLSPKFCYCKRSFSTETPEFRIQGV